MKVHQCRMGHSPGPAELDEFSVPVVFNCRVTDENSHLVEFLKVVPEAGDLLGRKCIGICGQLLDDGTEREEVVLFFAIPQVGVISPGDLAGYFNLLLAREQEITVGRNDEIETALFFQPTVGSTLAVEWIKEIDIELG